MSKFGHGFVTNLILLAKHFCLPPKEAWSGAADHLEELVVPVQWKGTEIDEMVTILRKKVIWHTPGNADKDEAEFVNRLLMRISTAVDKELGISDADTGSYR